MVILLSFLFLSIIVTDAKRFEHRFEQDNWRPHDRRENDDHERFRVMRGLVRDRERSSDRERTISNQADFDRKLSGLPQASERIESVRGTDKTRSRQRRSSSSHNELDNDIGRQIVSNLIKNLNKQTSKTRSTRQSVAGKSYEKESSESDNKYKKNEKEMTKSKPRQQQVKSEKKVTKLNSAKRRSVPTFSDNSNSNNRPASTGVQFDRSDEKEFARNQFSNRMQESQVQQELPQKTIVQFSADDSSARSEGSSNDGGSHQEQPSQQSINNQLLVNTNFDKFRPSRAFKVNETVESDDAGRREGFMYPVHHANSESRRINRRPILYPTSLHRRPIRHSLHSIARKSSGVQAGGRPEDWLSSPEQPNAMLHASPHASSWEQQVELNQAVTSDDQVANFKSLQQQKPQILGSVDLGGHNGNNAVTETCPKQFCSSACLGNLYKLDVITGCETCNCCPQLQCEDLCTSGYDADQDGCPMCKCL